MTIYIYYLKCPVDFPNPMTSWMLRLDSTQVLAARIAFGATTGNLSDFVHRRMGVVFLWI